MRRFLFDPNLISKGLVKLDYDESHHICKVLRMHVGEKIELIDGRGALFNAEVAEIGRQVVAQVLDQIAVVSDTNTQLTLCQGDLKGKKMDVLVQKCTELGVDCFISFTSSRSQGRVEKERVEKKCMRWRKMVEAACKQSLRLTLMDIETMSFEDLLNQEYLHESDLKILFWEQEQQVDLLSVDWTRSYKNACIMLGPEGGFSAEEVAHARDKGWLSMSLGKRILRAETAALTAVSIIQHRLGNI